MKKLTPATIAAAKKSIAALAPVVRRRALRMSNRREQDSPELPSLGTALRFVRTGSGMSQSALATRAGCSFKQISNIERAQSWPSPALFDRLCDALRIEAERVGE